MRFYFAYGSNMSRARLQARVGEVIDLGWSTLRGYRHAFNKHGADGTGKGNIVVQAGAEVHGVLYRLTHEQLAVLHAYEGGYRPADQPVVHRESADRHLSVAYEALDPLVGQMRPSDAYLTHYLEGMREHGLPDAYIQLILAQSRATLA